MSQSQPAPKRRRLLKFAVVTACLLVVILALSAERISGSFGPMQRHESQCLMCQRERVETWLSGRKVSDSISSNQYSDWIDSLAPPGHSHVWLVHTEYHRQRWFAPTSIGCGGVAVIPRIYEQRTTLGEQEARQLLAVWQKRVTDPAFDPNSLDEMDAFVDVIVTDPQSLLESDAE